MNCFNFNTSNFLRVVFKAKLTYYNKYIPYKASLKAWLELGIKTSCKKFAPMSHLSNLLSKTS